MNEAFLVFNQDNVSRADISLGFGPFLVMLERPNVVMTPEMPKFPGEILA